MKKRRVFILAVISFVMHFPLYSSCKRMLHRHV